MPMGFISGDGGSSPEDLFRKLPPISKALIVGMVLSVLAISLGIFTPLHYALAWPLVWKKFHVWRLISCGIFPGPPAFPTLFTMFSMGMYSIRYETDGFSTGGGGGSADYAYMLMFGFTVMETVMLLLFHQPYIIITQAVLFYICYVWSRKNPTMSVSMWGIVINAIYVPWVMVALNILLGQSIFMALLGIAVGHLFYFLVDVLPDLHDIDLLQTPRFLVDIFGWGNEGSGVHIERPREAMAPPGAVRPPRDIPRTGRAAGWGTGRPLGSS